MSERQSRRRDSARTAVPAASAERPMWQILAALYGSIGLLVAVVIVLVFGVASVVTGSAY